MECLFDTWYYVVWSSDSGSVQISSLLGCDTSSTVVCSYWTNALVSSGESCLIWMVKQPFETSVTLYQSIKHNISEDLYLIIIVTSLHLWSLLQPTQLFCRFACHSPKEPESCKWWNSNFINNWTLLILFILFHDCWNLQMCWMYGCAFENVCTTKPWYHIHNLSLPRYITDSCLRLVLKIRELQIHPPLKNSYCSRLAKR